MNCPTSVRSEDTILYKSGAKVGVIMGSTSDWETMREAVECLKSFGIDYEKKVVSAHRTPQLLFDYAESAEKRGLQCIIAGAGGAAHLPGMVAALTSLPVLGVPVRSRALDGLDSLLSIAQMPGGIPVATFPVGKEGARAAALFAVRLLAVENADLRRAIEKFLEK